MLRILLLACTLAIGAPALATAPTDESLRELMQVTAAEDLLENAINQVDAMMEASMEEALKGQPMTPGIRRTVDGMQGKVIAIMKEEMSWTKMEPMLLEVYRAAFNQSEIDGMLAFYKSDVGRSVIAKMPLVMQHTMRITQERMMAIMPRILQIEEETLQEIRAQAGR